MTPAMPVGERRLRHVTVLWATGRQTVARLHLHLWCRKQTTSTRRDFICFWGRLGSVHQFKQEWLAIWPLLGPFLEAAEISRPIWENKIWKTHTTRRQNITSPRQSPIVPPPTLTARTTISRARSTRPKPSSTRRTPTSIPRRRIRKAPNRNNDFQRGAGDHVGFSVGYMHIILFNLVGGFTKTEPISCRNCAHFLLELYRPRGGNSRFTGWSGADRQRPQHRTSARVSESALRQGMCDARWHKGNHEWATTWTGKVNSRAPEAVAPKLQPPRIQEPSGRTKKLWTVSGARSCGRPKRQ